MLTRRGFLGGMLAAAAAAVSRIDITLGEPTVFVFTCMRKDGTVSKRFEFTREQVAEHGMAAPLNEVHGQLLCDLLDEQQCVLLVEHAGRRVYRRKFECAFVESTAPADAARRWFEVVGLTRAASRLDDETSEREIIERMREAMDRIPKPSCSTATFRMHTDVARACRLLYGRTPRSVDELVEWTS